MNWLEMVCRIFIPALLGWLAVWVGITRIPWTPPTDED